MIRFFLVLLLAAVGIGGLTSLAVSKATIPAYPSFFYETLIFLVFATAVVYAYLYKLNKPGIFVQFYLLTMALKLLAYGGYNLVMILHDNPGAVVNVVFFMLVYVVFTALEIGFLYHKISHEKPS